MTFNVGNAIKYLWRAGLKADDFGEQSIQQELKDLEKARWYLAREIHKRGGSPL